MVGTREDVRRWASRWRAVAEKTHSEIGPESRTSAASGLALIEHLASIQGWPIERDAASTREALEARERWKLLLARWPR